MEFLTVGDLLNSNYPPQCASSVMANILHMNRNAKLLAYDIILANRTIRDSNDATLPQYYIFIFRGRDKVNGPERIFTFANGFVRYGTSRLASRINESRYVHKDAPVELLAQEMLEGA